MDKIIAHVFPSYPAAYAHLHDIWDRDDVLEVDKTRTRYKERGGVVHQCFAVRNRDDINFIHGFTFLDNVIHGEFSHLKPDDYEFLKGTLSQRTRHVPEVA